MSAIFSEKEHAVAVEKIKEAQEESLQNIRMAIEAMNETCQLSNQTLNEFSQYAAQVEKIRDSIQGIYMRIASLKTRVKNYKETQINPSDSEKNHEDTSMIDID